MEGGFFQKPSYPFDSGSGYFRISSSGKLFSNPEPPVGFYNQKFKNTNAPTPLTQDDIQFMRKFYEAKLGKYPDVLSSKQISSFTGYDTTSVNNWCEKNKLRHFCIKRKNLVPKVYLIDFLVSWDYIGIGVKSKRHKNMNKKLWKELQSQR